MKTAFLIIAIATLLSSCSFTIAPDGSKAGTLDGPAFAEVIRSAK